MNEIQWWGERWGGEGAALVGAAFEGRKFGTLAFALQYVSVSLYLFVFYSISALTVLFT